MATVMHSTNITEYDGKTHLLIISHRSSIKFPSPIIIGPASAMIRALGCTTVLLPKNAKISQISYRNYRHMKRYNYMKQPG